MAFGASFGRLTVVANNLGEALSEASVLPTAVRVALP